MAFDGIIPAVQSGQVDLGIAAFTNTPERAEEIDFSDLYETSAQLLIVKAGNADTYSTKESLAGLKVGAQKGTIQSQLIQSALPESELFELEKYPALALEVQNGNIAGLVVDQAVGEALVASSNGALEVSNFTFTAEEASFGKSVVIAKGSRVDPIAPHLDRGGAANLICPGNQISKHCKGFAVTGYLAEVQKVTDEEYAGWKKQYPDAFERDYDPAIGINRKSWVIEK